MIYKQTLDVTLNSFNRFGIFVVIVLVVLIGVGYWKGQHQKEFEHVEKVAQPVSIQQMEFLQNASAPYPFLTIYGPADTTGSSFVTTQHTLEMVKFMHNKEQMKNNQYKE